MFCLIAPTSKPNLTRRNRGQLHSITRTLAEYSCDSLGVVRASRCQVSRCNPAIKGMGCGSTLADPRLLLAILATIPTTTALSPSCSGHGAFSLFKGKIGCFVSPVGAVGTAARRCASRAASRQMHGARRMRMRGRIFRPVVRRQNVPQRLQRSRHLPQWHLFLRPPLHRHRLLAAKVCQRLLGPRLVQGGQHVRLRCRLHLRRLLAPHVSRRLFGARRL